MRIAECDFPFLRMMMRMMTRRTNLMVNKEELGQMKKVGSQQQLMDWMRRLERSLRVLSYQAGLRQRELKERRLREELGAARAVLMRQSDLLFTSCNVAVRYPDLETASSNRDNIHRSVDPPVILTIYYF